MVHSGRPSHPRPGGHPPRQPAPEPPQVPAKPHRLANSIWILLFAFMVAMGAMFAWIMVTSLAHPLGLRWTYENLAESREAALWLGAGAFAALLAWLAPDLVKGRSLGDDPPALAFLRTLMLAVTLATVWGTVLATALVLAWLLHLALPGRTALGWGAALAAAGALYVLLFRKGRGTFARRPRRTPGSPR